MPTILSQVARPAVAANNGLPVRRVRIMSDSRRTLVIAAVLVTTATALGAFGTHALRPVLPPARFDSFETGVQYQFFHSLGLLAIGVLQREARYDTPALRAAIRLLLLGMLLFAGSIYAMTFGAPRWFGMVAPFGGVSLMAAWLVFAWGVARAAPAGGAPDVQVKSVAAPGDGGLPRSLGRAG
jgi:uncharacterized membrane protein YgdD (TMEM256/DUF423 family)